MSKWSVNSFKKAATAVCFMTILGVWAAGTGTASAAPAAASLPIGVVDYAVLIEKHPDTAKANEALRAERDQAKKDYDTQSVNLGDKEKQELDRQLGQKVEQKRQELLKAIAIKVNAAIKEVVDAKGLTMLVQKNVVIFGGQDITEEVLKKIGAN